MDPRRLPEFDDVGLPLHELRTLLEAARWYRELTLTGVVRAASGLNRMALNGAIAAAAEAVCAAERAVRDADDPA